MSTRGTGAWVVGNWFGVSHEVPMTTAVVATASVTVSVMMVVGVCLRLMSATQASFSF